MTEQLDIDRVFAAPVDQVWRALTVPSSLSQWFWPFAMNARVDPRPGGVYRLDAPAMGMAMDGTVTDAQAPRALGLSWRWEGEPEQTHVHISLAPDGDGTQMHVTHDGFALATTRDDHIKGWNDCLDRLPDWLSANG
jgi:uncharacterized protein YndB with AHSA1/START domain